MDFEDIREILYNSAINDKFKIVLAYVVIGELDKLKKDPNKELALAARRANNEIRLLQLMKHESFECQVSLLHKMYKFKLFIH